MRPWAGEGLCALSLVIGSLISIPPIPREWLDEGANGRDFARALSPQSALKAAKIAVLESAMGHKGRQRRAHQAAFSVLGPGLGLQAVQGSRPRVARVRPC